MTVWCLGCGRACNCGRWDSCVCPDRCPECEPEEPMPLDEWSCYDCDMTASGICATHRKDKP